MEAEATRWVVEEYLEVARMALEAGVEPVFCGVDNPLLEAPLRRAGARVCREPGWLHYNTPKTIVLDPAAPARLEPWEAQAADYIVVGGIMGDHPPRGRTYLVSAMYTSAARRNLGPHQLSVDGAAYVALQVARGATLDEVPLAVGATLEVETPMGTLEVELPYAYPAGPDGKPRIAPGVKRLLERGILWDEQW